MSHLRICRIEEICDLIKGTYPTLKTKPGEYPLVVTAQFRRSASTYQIDGKAVCIPLISSTGHGDAALHRVHYEKGKFAVANLLVALVIKDENICLPKYLYYLLNTKRDDYFVPLMKGTANVSLKINDIAQVEVPLPPLSEQRRIVAKIEQLAAKIEEAQKLRQQSMDGVYNLVESKFRQTLEKDDNHVQILPFTGLAKLERRPIVLNPEEEYREVGVYCFGRGIFHKPPRVGFEIGAKKLYWIKDKDLILQITFAWEGAVGLAGPQENGMCGSVRFPTFVVNEEICDPRYLLMYLKTNEGIAQLGRISPGSAGRNRVLSLKRLDEVLVPVLPLSLQQSLMDDVGAKTAQIRQMQEQTAAELDALLPSILDKAFKGEL